MSQKSIDNNCLTVTSAAQNSHSGYFVLLYICYTYILFTYETREYMPNKKNEINVWVTPSCAGDPRDLLQTSHYLCCICGRTALRVCLSGFP